MKMQKLSLLCLVAFTLIATPVFADDPPKTPEDLERDAAIAEFTRKQIEANYGPKFEQAAKEFNVPVEILMGVSFSETRHEHLTWPAGETHSPDNGMPRPYGIMSLWDNEHFGHSLLEAAQLIGKSPEDLKKDPLDNMRGGAALLRKHYDENPKPKWAAENSVESWNYAIRKYCGIPELELNARHAMDVYDFLEEGYDQFGIKLKQVEGLKLDEMRAETKRIVAEEREKAMQSWTPEDFEAAGITPPARVRKEEPAPAPAAAPAPAPIAATTPEPTPWALIIVLIATALALAFFIFRKKPQPQKNQTKK